MNLTFKERVGFKAFGGTELSCLSKGDSVLVREPGFPQRCPIVDIVPYTPQMEAADKAAAPRSEPKGRWDSRLPAAPRSFRMVMGRPRAGSCGGSDARLISVSAAAACRSPTTVPRVFVTAA